MQIHHRSIVVAALALSSTVLLRAQAAPDASGHWEGAVKVPGHEINIQVDVTKTAAGEMQGIFTGENINGFPLSDLGVERDAVRFRLRVDGGGSFSGTISADGKTISGDFTANNGAFTIPFSLTRTGDARIEPPAKSAAVSKQLEGSWNATLEANGVEMRIVLKLTNQPDGSSTGTLANLDQGGVEIPIASISQQAANVTLEVKVVSGSYSGAVNADGTELAGTWTQGAFTAPLNFHRGGAAK
jgi:hypothetical protein